MSSLAMYSDKLARLPRIALKVMACAAAATIIFVISEFLIVTALVYATGIGKLTGL